MSDSVSRRIGRRRLLEMGLLAAAALPFSARSANAQDYVFNDEFDGYLNPNWRASLPDYEHHNPDRGDGIFSSFVTHWAGSPQIQFGTLDGASVLRLNQLMAPLTHNGLLTQNVYKMNSFRYEVRFNTLTQGPYSTNPAVNHSIDGFIEIGLFDSADPARYDVVSLFGNRFNLERTFQANSGIDGSGNGWHHPLNEDGTTDPIIRDGGVVFDYQDNTWYRLVLTGGAGQNISAFLESDSGQLLVAWVFAHDISGFPHGFRLSLSQYMGFPPQIFPVDVAVDYVRLTGQVTGTNRPALSALSISSTIVGSATFPLTIYGSGFQVGSVAKWQNLVLNTTVVNSGELTATVPASLLTKVTVANITVVNPGPPSTPSGNALRFSVTAGGAANIRISSQPRTANSFGDGQLEIDVKNFGSGTVTGISFDSGDQSFQADPATDIRANNLTVIVLPEGSVPFWDGTLQAGQAVRLRIVWELPGQRSGAATIRGRSPQGNFIAGQVNLTFPS